MALTFAEKNAKRAAAGKSPLGLAEFNTRQVAKGAPTQSAAPPPPPGLTSAAGSFPSNRIPIGSGTPLSQADIDAARAAAGTPIEGFFESDLAKSIGLTGPPPTPTPAPIVNTGTTTGGGGSLAPPFDLTPDFTGTGAQPTTFTLEAPFGGAGEDANTAFESAINALPGGEFDPTQINQLITQANQPADSTSAAVQEGLLPFLEGPLGQSGLTNAAIEQFKIQTLPILEGQISLAGLSGGGALADATARALGVALPEFILADLDNRFRAAEGLQGQQAANLAGTQTGLQGAISSAQIGQSQQQLGIQEALGLGELTLAARGQTFEQQIASAQQRLNEEIQRGNLVVTEQGLVLQGLTAAETLAQSAAAQSSEIANRIAQRQLAAADTAARLLLGLAATVSIPLFESVKKQFFDAITAIMATGEVLIGEVEGTLNNLANIALGGGVGGFASGLTDLTGVGTTQQ